MGGCTLIWFGHAELNFRDRLMVVVEDNGVRTELFIFISPLSVAHLYGFDELIFNSCS